MTDRKKFLEAEKKRLEEAIDEAEGWKKYFDRHVNKNIGKTTHHSSKTSTRIDTDINEVKRTKYYLRAIPILIFLGIVIIAVMQANYANLYFRDKNMLLHRLENIESYFFDNAPYNILQAWHDLRDPFSGKHGQALTFIANDGKDLKHTNLSCKASGDWNEEASTCKEPTQLQNLKLYAYQNKIDLSHSNFSQTDLTGTVFRAVMLKNSQFDHSTLKAVSLTHTNLEGASFRHADLFRTQFYKANISNANFESAKHINSRDIHHAWAWQDRPPRNLKLAVKFKNFCDPALRPEFEKEKSIGKPKRC